MHKQFRTTVVISVRTTCWEKGARPENEEYEIIEMGSCFIDVTSLEISRKQSLLLRPQRSKVSAFCTRLTTLTQEQIDAEDIAFPQACLSFKQQNMHEYVWASFGVDHRVLIERECLARQAPYPLGPLHLDVRLLTTLHLQLLQEPSMARTLTLLGLPPLHNSARRAGDAACNTARVLALQLAQLRPSAKPPEPLS